MIEGKSGLIRRLPPLLVAVVEAWRKRGKTIQISVSGMEFETWKPFREEVSKNRRIQALRLREITDSVANIDVECWRSYSNEALAEDLCRLESVKLAVTEVTAKRIKLTVVK